MLKNRVFQWSVGVSITLFLLACGGGGGGGGNSGGGAGGGTPTTQPSPFDDVFSVRNNSSYVLRLDGKALRPREITTGFGANGHTQTWDGRVFIASTGRCFTNSSTERNIGWVVRVMRPERLVQNTAPGEVPSFTGVFTSREPEAASLECDGEPNTGMEGNQGEITGRVSSGNAHNSIHASPMPPRLASSADNPFKSDANGEPQADGAYETYELMVITSKMIDDRWHLGRRYARVVLSNPRTTTTQVQKAEFFNPETNAVGFPLEVMRDVNGDDIKGIEPSATFDGRLVVYQGHPNRSNDLLTLMYTWNETPGAAGGWSVPRPLSSMYELEANTMVAGIPFKERYPLAKEPLRRWNGEVYATGSRILGAYPWVSLDGTEVVFTNGFAGLDGRDRSLRGALSIMGQATGWINRHIDGPLNPDRQAQGEERSVRLFFSSPGLIPSIWTPYKELEQKAIPYTSRKWVFPLFGSNTNDYGEVNMEDFMDGNYITILHMNEVVTDSGRYTTNFTPDTSGRFAGGELVGGARFPYEARRDLGQQPYDMNPGIGRAIYLPDAGYIRVNGENSAFGEVNNGLTVELFVNPLVNLSGHTNPIYFVKKTGSFFLRLSTEGRLEAGVNLRNGTEVISVLNNPGLTVGTWKHLAMTYENKDGNGTIKVFIDGELLSEDRVTGGGQVANTATNNLYVGDPEGSGLSGQYVMMVDELKVSKVARLNEELRDSAYVVSTSTQAEGCLQASEIPAGVLSSLPSWVNTRNLCFPRTSLLAGAQAERAIALGDRLFNDTRLSSNGELSCGSCHDEARAFQDNGITPNLPDGTQVPRDTPSLFNLAINPGIGTGWVGAAKTTIEQTDIALVLEMGAAAGDLLALINETEPSYGQELQAIYGSATTMSNVLTRIKQVLDAYVLAQISGDTNVDLQNQNPGSTYITSTQVNGQKLFVRHCAGCHAGSNFTDNQFHNNCFFETNQFSGGFQGATLIKTPGLRNLLQTAPYMHDGQVGSIAEVVDIYNQGGRVTSECHPDVMPLGLSDAEKNQLVRFLEEL
jgi:cytochrome c peroxidase